MACVPGAKPVLVMDADPFETKAAVPRAVAPSKSCTCPFAPTDASTLMLNLNPFGSLEASLELFTDSLVIVATGPPPPPPPPALLQPNAKLSTHTSPSPSAARYRLRPGRNSSSIATSPVPALSVHQPLPPRVGMSVAT